VNTRKNQDRIRNTYIREELKMQDIWNKIKISGLRWYGHIKRADQNRIPKDYWK
jgi:hypothetical protein